MSRRSGKQRYYQWPKCNTPHPPPPLKLYLYWLTAGTVTRLCMIDGNWADPDVLECESQQFLQILSEVTSKQPCSYEKKKQFTNHYKYIYVVAIVTW